MIKHFSEIPKEHQDFLIKKFDKWKSENIPADDKDAAKNSVKYPMVYMIRMWWLARKDKHNSYEYHHYRWISENFLPSDIPYDEKLHPEPLIPRDVDHNKLADQAFEDLWYLYSSSEVAGFVEPEPEKSFFGKIKETLINIFKNFSLSK